MVPAGVASPGARPLAGLAFHFLGNLLGPRDVDRAGQFPLPYDHGGDGDHRSLFLSSISLKMASHNIIALSQPSNQNGGISGIIGRTC